MRPIALLICVLTVNFLYSQTGTLQATGANTAPFTPQNLVTNILLGQGVEVTSITYGGDAAAVGYFSGGQSVIGIDRGIIMTTGRVASGPTTIGCTENGLNFASNDATGNASSPQLSALVGAGSTLNDVAVYTIKFIPTSSNLQFRYCFASEEYPEYACSQYNDVFGFFISGPGLPNDTNIAKIPNSNLPVSINNIHPNNSQPGQPCPAFNAQYYNSNLSSNKQPTYDGFTDVFVARATVIPCQEYTIRLAIADIGDSAFDSGVFLEAKSFESNSMRVEFATVSNDGTVTEGCSPGSLTFKIPAAVSNNTPIDYNIWGSAINGVDFQFIDTALYIPAGQTQIVVPVVGLEDNIAEGSEYLAIDVQRDPCNRDTIYLFVRENSILAPTLRPDTSVCIGGAPLVLNGTLPIAQPQPYVFTNNQDYSLLIPFIPVESSINVFGVQPTTLTIDMIRSVCIDITHPFDDDLDIFLIAPNGKFVELSTDNGGSGDNYTNTCFTPVATNPINAPGPQAPASATPFTGDFMPEGVWSDLIDPNAKANGIWKLQVTDDGLGFPPPGTGTLNSWSITFEPAYQIDYLWAPATGLSCPTCPITDAAPTTNTTYVLTASDNYGCTVSDDFKMDVQTPLPAPVVACGNSGNSSVNFEWPTVPGAEGYEISIDGGAWIPLQNLTTYSVTGLPPSTPVNAQVRAVSSTALCVPLIGLGSCINCSPPNVLAIPTAAKCANSTDGSVTITTDNIHPPYMFRVGAASNATGIFPGLAGGAYVATITDGLGCDTLLNFTIPAPAALIPTVTTQQNVSCFGGTNGILSINITGGTGAYNIVWANPNDPTSGTNLPVGTYGVTVTDANNCSVSALGTISEPQLLQVSATSVDAKCSGTATGILNATGIGGVMPYSYVWDVGPGAPINGVDAGTYTVTLTDFNNCTTTATATINEPDLLTASTNTTPTQCSNSLDGTATVDPVGGTVPYTYKWNDPAGQITQTAINLGAQPYSVTVSDNQGCTTVVSAAPTSPPALVVTVTESPVSCNGGNNGQAIAAPNGGNGGFTYKWSNSGTPQTTATAVGLTFGPYTVTVTDNKGCTTTGNITVSQPTPLLLSVTAIPTSCFGSNDGIAKVLANGATPNYTYIWNTGDNTANIDYEPAGTYTVTVTDAKNCSATASISINQPNAILLQATPDPVECYGTSTGGIVSTVSGGAGGFSIVWVGPNNFVSDQFNLEYLFAGDYIARITDAAGCIEEQTISVNQPQQPLYLTTPIVSDTICFEAANGIAITNAAGGTTPYTYIWDDDNNQTTSNATGLDVALYRVTVTDINGCTAIDSTYVVQKGQLFAYLEAEAPRCHDGADGEGIIAFISYGSQEAPTNLFDYVWSTDPAQTSVIATGLVADQTYTVTVTDDEGCTAHQTVTVGNRPLLEVDFDNILGVKCFGDANGQARAIGQGGTQPYTYLWSPNVGSQTAQWAENLIAGDYRVTLTDDKGCYAIKNIVIEQPEQLKTDFSARHVDCFGANTGSASVIVSGGTEPFVYLWENGAVTTEATGLSAGDFSILITDNNKCQLSDSVLIRQPDAPLTATVLTTDVNCFGDNDGKIEITGLGGTPPYRFALNNGSFNGSPLQIGLKAGDYTPRIQDINGCITELDRVILAQRSAVQVELGPDITIELGQSAQLAAVITGAVDPLTLEWDEDGSTWLSCMDCMDPSVDSLFFQESFNIYVIDSTGCRAEDRITVVVEKPRRIFVPTGFSPNGDNNNDLLLVHGQESAKILEFVLYDRWGEEIYRAANFTPNDQTVGWDGNFKGKPMDPGAYIWVLEVEYMDGQKDVLKGHSMLLR